MVTSSSCMNSSRLCQTNLQLGHTLKSVICYLPILVDVSEVNTPTGRGTTEASTAAHLPVWCPGLLVKICLSKFSENFEDGLAHSPLICESTRMGHGNNMFCVICERRFFQCNSRHIELDLPANALFQAKTHRNDRMYSQADLSFGLA